jgi:hypothetical protein
MGDRPWAGRRDQGNLEAALSANIRQPKSARILGLWRYTAAFLVAEAVGQYDHFDMQGYKQTSAFASD